MCRLCKACRGKRIDPAAFAAFVRLMGMPPSLYSRVGRIDWCTRAHRKPRTGASCQRALSFVHEHEQADRSGRGRGGGRDGARDKPHRNRDESNADPTQRGRGRGSARREARAEMLSPVSGIPDLSVRHRRLARLDARHQ